MTQLSGENGTESESQAFLESLIQQLDDPTQQTMPAGMGKLLVGFLQRLDHQLNEVTDKLESTMSRLSVAEEMLFANASNIRRQHHKPAQVPKAQGASDTIAAPKAQEAPRAQMAAKAQATPKAPVLAPKAQATSTKDASRVQAEQPAPKAKAPLPAVEQLAPKAKAPSPSVEQPAHKAQAPSPSPDMNDQIIQCPDCEGLLAWSDYSEGDYKEGWGCNNGEAGCQHNAETDGMFRWFCPVCLNDFCGACGEIEAQAQAMMEPGEPKCGKAAQDAADALMQEAEAIMKAELSAEEQPGPVVALPLGNSKHVHAPRAAERRPATASLSNGSELTQAAEARDIAALLPDDAKLARAAEAGDIAALLPNDSQLASVQRQRGVVGTCTSAMALGAAASKAAPMPKRTAQPPLSAPQPAIMADRPKAKPAEVAVVQAQGEEVVEEEEGEEEEEVVDDGTVEPEAVPSAVPTITQAEVTVGAGQVAQEATAAACDEEVIEEEEEEEEEYVEDATVEPGEEAPTLAAVATEPEEAEVAADSQLMAQLSQTVKRKARAGLVASTPGKRPRAAT
eukprot:TRINITY_DN76246_c0_g1_i1.p1 TRINITY_DN76246_c0_g1~~TRINITY_DN76246_c0_g1_i1.p1  ORF type:complete len:565 (+),score=177.87 TRINITY_DN76246_c0_g1_i1:102-1796(+)